MHASSRQVQRVCCPLGLDSTLHCPRVAGARTAVPVASSHRRVANPRVASQLTLGAWVPQLPPHRQVTNLRASCQKILAARVPELPVIGSPQTEVRREALLG